MFPIILICFIIFVVFLNSRKRQITKQEQEITEQFCIGKWLQFGAKTKEFFKGVNFSAFSLPTK